MRDLFSAYSYIHTCLSCFRNGKWSMPKNVAGTLHIRYIRAMGKQQHVQGYEVCGPPATELHEKPESNEDNIVLND